MCIVAAPIRRPGADISDRIIQCRLEISDICKIARQVTLHLENMVPGMDPEERSDTCQDSVGPKISSIGT